MRKFLAVATVIAALLLAPAPAYADPVQQSSEQDESRPSRGLAGRYQDSNVYEVWRGASHSERMTWLCIRRHESMSYTGENPYSTASGAGQWLNGTWDGLKEWVKFRGKFVARQYDEAKDAPAWVQDLAFRHVYKQGDLSMWRGTHCAPAMGAH